MYAIENLTNMGPASKALAEAYKNSVVEQADEPRVFLAVCAVGERNSSQSCTVAKSRIVSVVNELVRNPTIKGFVVGSINANNGTESASTPHTLNARV